MWIKLIGFLRRIIGILRKLYISFIYIYIYIYIKEMYNLYILKTPAVHRNTRVDQ
jgi:hypothetical protein